MVIKSIIHESRHLRTRVSSFVAATVIAGGSLAAATPLFLNQTAFAAPTSTTVVVTPANTQGWSTADTRTGGAVNYVHDTSSPLPSGALQLTTDATTTSKAQYLHAASTPLSQVTKLSYATKQVSGPAFADPSYQLIACLNGGTTAATCGFTTLVFEPYQNTAQKAIVPNTWQSWDVSGTGLFWSSRTVTCGNNVIAGTPGGPAIYTLADIKAACPNAVATGFGVNIGTNNPAYNVETDAFNFNGTTYNFEINNVPTNKNQCKNGGYKDYTDANGNAFKNQGQCVSFVNGGGSSSNKVKNTNTVTITNNSSQSATSGNASSNSNTNGGSSNSGNATNNNTSTNTVVISNNPKF